MTENRAQHTPGPWVWIALNWGWQVLPESRGPHHTPVIASLSGSTRDREREADASLIAAAPVMYSALLEARRVMQLRLNEEGAVTQRYAALVAAIGEADAAIASATGEAALR